MAVRVARGAWCCQMPNRIGSWQLGLCLCLLALLMLPVARVADQQPIKAVEPALKAAFLCSFPDYVTWPAAEQSGTTNPSLVIGLLSDEVLAGSVQQVVDKKKAAGKKIEVRRSMKAEDLADCQVVFISISESERVRQHLAVLNGKPILTVSDCPGFLDAGGMIEFVLEGKKLRFEVDLTRAESEKLLLRASMLNLAKNVRHQEGGTK